MRTTRSSSKKATKAKLAGFVADGEATNKKIVFDEDDEVESHLNDDDAQEVAPAAEDKSDDEDDAVEEVKGSSARESTQLVRDEERKIAKETTAKKKRSKKKDTPKLESTPYFSDKDDKNEDILTDDFFKMVDSERADKLELTKQERKQKKHEQKKLLGKHTTFVVEDEYNLVVDAPKKYGQNIEVVAIGTGQADEDDQDEEDRRNLLSATLGSTSKASSIFARGSLTQGASRERSCESRKRGTNDDETWTRSKTKVFRPGTGRAAVLFAKRK